MATTLRQSIVSAVVTRMGLINGSSPYETAAGSNVSEWRSDADLYDRDNELPAIGVHDSSDDWEAESFSSVAPEFKHTLRVQLRCLATTPAIIRKVVGDVHTAINTDRTWGGLAVQTMPISDRLIVDEAERKVMGAIVEIEILYRTLGYGPYTQG
jgi:hypothetical protein